MKMDLINKRFLSIGIDKTLSEKYDKSRMLSVSHNKDDQIKNLYLDY